MYILVALLSIFILPAVVFYGLLALLRQTIEDTPYAAPAAYNAEAMQTAGPTLPSKDAERRSCGEGCT